MSEEAQSSREVRTSKEIPSSEEVQLSEGETSREEISSLFRTPPSVSRFALARSVQVTPPVIIQQRQPIQVITPQQQSAQVIVYQW